MSRKKKIDPVTEYIRIHKMLARKEELERNGGRWVAKDRPHKNKKKYDRKRDRRIDTSVFFVKQNSCLCTAKYPISLYLSIYFVGYGKCKRFPRQGRS